MEHERQETLKLIGKARRLAKSLKSRILAEEGLSPIRFESPFKDLADLQAFTKSFTSTQRWKDYVKEHPLPVL